MYPIIEVSEDAPDLTDRLLGKNRPGNDSSLWEHTTPYAKWIPSKDRRYADVLDTSLEKLGAKLT